MADVTVTLNECEARALRRTGEFSFAMFQNLVISDEPLAIETALMKLETAMVAEGVTE